MTRVTGKEAKFARTFRKSSRKRGFFFGISGFGVGFWALSGPVLRDTARLSQRYPPIARYGVFAVSTWPIGCDTPSPFSQHFPLGEHASGVAIPPPTKGVSFEDKTNGCDNPLCDTFSKRYCATWGGISHWAAKSGPLFLVFQDYKDKPNIVFHNENLQAWPRKHVKGYPDSPVLVNAGWA